MFQYAVNRSRVNIFVGLVPATVEWRGIYILIIIVITNTFHQKIVDSYCALIHIAANYHLD